ncbi:myo-inosose-2 dehydratase [Legionella taurinensis]|uniref:Myo-inosose-2 dehydratase n=1 Tax=Legionella taurinensis TaxID=70611 RepID=A0A3A5L381_9GAMM|nr:myo-inosose-2 dehydratase [Legionella taurinensis]RJT46229.1 myo-inosose-2 dehydratase [Legionella taurinensis]RJT67055.1 myo-inosose-2 dehydratase [Legionella taurinensis]STY26459.1 myo-inositol catabolism protein iolE [Legionella taurinensis]
MTIKLGIAPINWCNDDDPSLGRDISFEQCLREMAEAGFVGTEMGNKYPRNLAVLKQSLAEKGLEMASAWFSTFFTEAEQYDATLSRFLDHLSFMRALGARFVNVCECGGAIQGTPHPILGHNKPQFSASQWQQLIQGLHTIGRIAHDFNMQIAYHYHAGTGVFHEQEIDYLMQHTSPELVALLLDTGHAAMAGIHPVSLIKKHGQRIRYVHLKDIRSHILHQVQQQELSFMDAVRLGVFTVPGDGQLDFAAVVDELRQLNYQGWMIVEAEQDPAKAPPLDYARKAYAYLTEVI